jgi:hypothetical protein
MSALNWISIFTANYPSNWRLGNNLFLLNIKFIFISKGIELSFVIETIFSIGCAKIMVKNFHAKKICFDFEFE